jgi:hypothetical protein
MIRDRTIVRFCNRLAGRTGDGRFLTSGASRLCGNSTSRRLVG